jgi:hypothetical protein
VLAQFRPVLLHLYNPGSKGNYTIKIKMSQIEINIVTVNNSTTNGDLICPNISNSNDC